MTGEPGPETDPTRIRSVAVHREDVANALEATLRSDRTVVLRVTPPYAGRMRARIHRVETAKQGESGIAGGDENGSSGPIHLDPRELVETIPAYPEVDDTTAERPGSDLETRRKRHAEAVETWREQVRQAVGGTVSIPIGRRRDSSVRRANAESDERTETHDVDVVVLG